MPPMWLVGAQAEAIAHGGWVRAEQRQLSGEDSGNWDPSALSSERRSEDVRAALGPGTSPPTFADIAHQGHTLFSPE